MAHYPASNTKQGLDLDLREDYIKHQLWLEDLERERKSRKKWIPVIVEKKVKKNLVIW